MAEHGNEIDERGFIDELVDMLVANPFRSEEDDIGEFLRDEETPFNIESFINTLGRETISSEPRVRGDFTERLPRADSVFSMAQFEAETATNRIGTDIVLSSILEQLNLPAELKERGGFAFADFDIIDFFGDKSNVSEMDLAIGTKRNRFSLDLLGLDM